MGGYALGLAVLLVVSVPAQGAITLMSSNVGATQLFSGSMPRSGAPADEWYVPSASLSNQFFVGSPAFPLGNGTLEWTGNALSSDQSSGGVALATFAPGGTFKWYGTITSSPSYTGLLFEGTVEGFSVEESQLNRVDILGSPRIVPVAGSSAYFNSHNLLMPAYELSMQNVLVMQDNDDLWDFFGNIDCTAGSQFVLVGVPEPTTLALLAAGLFLTGFRRNTSSR